MKVGIIGELYTPLEPFANYDLEKLLASYGIAVKRYTNVHYLLFEKKYKIKKYLKYAREYVKYKMGADAADNIARTKYLCANNYDGIIHIKSSFVLQRLELCLSLIRYVRNIMFLLYFSLLMQQHQKLE